jgi:hypothetical protein
MSIAMIRRGGFRGTRINRKKRNKLSESVENAPKLDNLRLPSTNPDKKWRLFLDRNVRHVIAENAVVFVSYSAVLLPSYQPGISWRRSSQKFVEHQGFKSHP